MHGDIEFALRGNLRDKEYAEGYAESFLNSYIATQIKVIREQRGMTQAELGIRIGTTQAGISRYEDVNYSSWSLRTLMKLARAFDVRLRVSFEPYGTLPDEVIRFDRARLQVVGRENDPGLFTVKNKMEAGSGLVTDIGVFKALAGSGQARNEGGQLYGTRSGFEGESPDDDRVGRAIERRQGSDVGLCSLVG